MDNMKERTSYDILSISRDASLDDVKNSYKRLVKLWHPDQYVNFPDKRIVAEEKLKELNIAYRDIVALLKRNPAEPHSPPEMKTSRQPTGKTHPEKKKSGITFWNQITLLINKKFHGLKGSEKSIHEDPLHSKGIRHGGVDFTGSKDRSSADFQQILEKAIRNKKPGGGGRKRPGNRKHIHKRFGSASFYRPETNKRRDTGDRVEKISPVGRVNRIGGD